MKSLNLFKVIKLNTYNISRLSSTVADKINISENLLDTTGNNDLVTINNNSIKKFNKVAKISFLYHPYQLTEVPIDENVKSPEDDLFAIVTMKGSQHKITINDVIVVDNVDNVDIGQIVKLGEVMMLGSRKGTIIGHPFIDGAEVTGEVEEITKDRKVHIFKFRRRKNSKRLRGFRRSLVTIRIHGINPGNNHKEFTDKL